MEKGSLVSEIASGSHAAYKDLFMTYFPKVKIFIVHFVKSEATAEDLAQEIFVKIWENREKLAPVQSINSYIYQMARNATLNYIEHQNIEKKYLEQYEGDTSEHILEEELYARETELLVRLTVDRMPSQRKKIYLMSREEGLKNDEIAEQMNITKKTVENHLNIALKEIRKAISLLALFFV
jgi:RNA polymerase sigma-70 factor (ECF subfamily)